MPRKKRQLQDPDMIAVPVLLPKSIVSALITILLLTKNSLEEEIQRAVLTHVSRQVAEMLPVLKDVIAQREAASRRRA